MRDAGEPPELMRAATMTFGMQRQGKAKEQIVRKNLTSLITSLSLRKVRVLYRGEFQLGEE